MDMAKKYQVFISSTYKDLKDERKETMQALLELGCIPCGMELFQASDEDQWTLIKRVIDDSDYYLCIIGGRYGSTNDKGMSFTEMEYRYALEINKPIISFLHGEPHKIEAGKTEQSPKGKVKLAAFIELVKKERHIRTWTTPSELGGLVSRGIVSLIKQRPAIGWIKANSGLNESISQELSRTKYDSELINMITTAKDKEDLYVSIGEGDFIVSLITRLYIEARSGQGPLPMIKRIIIKRLSDELCKKLLDYGFLKPGFDERMKNNLYSLQINENLKYFNVEVVVKEWNILPFFHGFLFNNRFLTNSWSIDESGWLHVASSLKNKNSDKCSFEFTDIQKAFNE